jgi:predicted transposase/invertase (TIGR01784 family)
MFKKVFGDKENTNPIRILLKCILDIDAKEIQILNPEVIGSSYYDKRTIVDLIVRLEDGTKIGIEMNTNVNRYLIDRNIFYMFKVMSSDMKKGSLYNNLNKHIQINIDCEGKHIKPIERYCLMEREGIKY